MLLQIGNRKFISQDGYFWECDGFRLIPSAYIIDGQVAEGMQWMHDIVREGKSRELQIFRESEQLSK